MHDETTAQQAAIGSREHALSHLGAEDYDDPCAALAECIAAAREGRLYDVDTQSDGHDGLEIGDDADEVIASLASACECETTRGWTAERLTLVEPA